MSYIILFYNCMVAFACCYSHAVDKSSSQKVSSASGLQIREYSQCICTHGCSSTYILYNTNSCVVVNVYDLGKEWSVMWYSFISSIMSYNIGSTQSI